jgi:hypothetical protein
LTIGYFRQDVEEMQGRSVLDEAIAGSGRVGDLHRTVRWSIVTRLIGSWLALHHNQKHHTDNGINIGKGQVSTIDHR